MVPYTRRRQRRGLQVFASRGVTSRRSCRSGGAPTCTGHDGTASSITVADNVGISLDGLFVFLQKLRRLVQNPHRSDWAGLYAGSGTPARRGFRNSSLISSSESAGTTAARVAITEVSLPLRDGAAPPRTGIRLTSNSVAIASCRNRSPWHSLCLTLRDQNKNFATSCRLLGWLLNVAFASLKFGRPGVTKFNTLPVVVV